MSAHLKVRCLATELRLRTVSVNLGGLVAPLPLVKVNSI
jgi:hypothetical protein